MNLIRLRAHKDKSEGEGEREEEFNLEEDTMGGMWREEREGGDGLLHGGSSRQIRKTWGGRGWEGEGVTEKT